MSEKMILGAFCTNNAAGNAVNNALQDDIFRVGPFLETLDRKHADREPHVGPPCVQRKPNTLVPERPAETPKHSHHLGHIQNLLEPSVLMRSALLV